jgi:hypothetical protein
LIRSADQIKAIQETADWVESHEFGRPGHLVPPSAGAQLENMGDEDITTVARGVFLPDEAPNFAAAPHPSDVPSSYEPQWRQKSLKLFRGRRRPTSKIKQKSGGVNIGHSSDGRDKRQRPGQFRQDELCSKPPDEPRLNNAANNVINWTKSV